MRIAALIILYATVFLGACYTYASEQAPQKLKVGVSMRPLFQYIDEDHGFTGLDVELSDALFDRAGIDIEFVAMSWKRILKHIEQGKLDVALSAAKSDTRAQYANFTSEHLRLGHTVLFTHEALARRLKKFSSLSDLSKLNLNIGAVDGVSYSNEYEHLLAEQWFTDSVIMVSAYDLLPELLISRKIDAYLGSERGQLSLIQEKNLKQQIVPVFYLNSDEDAKTYLMFSKKTVSDAWVKRIDNSLKRFKQSREFETIIKKYAFN